MHTDDFQPNLNLVDNQLTQHRYPATKKLNMNAIDTLSSQT